jgi:alkylation response protein AidB-like acyl-CoA dehydrogenase
MDFDLSDDELALRDTAGEMLDDLAAPVRVRAFTETDDLYDAALWRAMVDQGWLAIGVAEEAGGLGGGMVEPAMLVEQLGRHAAPVPLTPTTLAAGACARGGYPIDFERYLGGGWIGCVAWSADAAAVVADAEGSGWVLTGRTDPTPYAPAANVAVVPARTTDGPALFAVDLAQAGRPAREPAIDVTRPLGWLRFDRTPATRLGGAEHVEAVLDRGACLASFEMLGGARTVLERSVEYAKDRVQFGRPIGSFQAVKHRCADMLVDVEGMHSAAYWAAWALGAGDADASIAASTAKVWCADASKRVMASGLQVHGGIGFTWEHPAHLYLKRAKSSSLLLGDPVFHRERLASELGL